MKYEKIELFEKQSACCGCGACSNICPQNAICMTEDQDGYVYPEIDIKKCVRCGLCKKVCSYQNGVERNSPISVKIAMNQNAEQLLKSSSGGVFAALAEAILQEKGVVYGAGYSRENSELLIKHLRVDQLDKLNLLQGSKYSQSVIGDSFSLVKQDLISGKKVLFSGTPCQVAGLKGYLGKEYDGLYTVDIVCHGVPNQRQFSSFIKYIEKKYGGKVEKFSFRDKALGWSDFYIRVDIRKNNGTLRTKSIHCKNSAFYILFLNSDIYRENCYSCPYTNEFRVGDITLGDYWGIENVHSELFENEKWKEGLKKGISCMLLNTRKAEALFDMCKVSLITHDSSFEKAAKENGQLNHPSKMSKQRMHVLEMWNQYGYKKVQKDFRRKSGWRYYNFCVRKKVAPLVKRYFSK